MPEVASDPGWDRRDRFIADDSGGLFGIEPGAAANCKDLCRSDESIFDSQMKLITVIELDVFIKTLARRRISNVIPLRTRGYGAVFDLKAKPRPKASGKLTAPLDDVIASGAGPMRSAVPSNVAAWR